MPLISCPVCDKDISSQAITCPGCGHPIKKQELKTHVVYLRGAAARLGMEELEGMKDKGWKVIDQREELDSIVFKLMR